ncbi:TonB-dependent receptor domain-containing protein [Oecophyllibacter saccharovorans]|uniref:TonB-dependent receptor domain-containing protein n=1 Tax=Oecophyllibacter saccharovorans TaxID=2558360 RepID=UPI001E349177|nr:TonB-dependent receptor [Oecophyllibacter saccharovorans]
MTTRKTPYALLFSSMAAIILSPGPARASSLDPNEPYFKLKGMPAYRPASHSGRPGRQAGPHRARAARHLTPARAEGRRPGGPAARSADGREIVPLSSAGTGAVRRHRRRNIDGGTETMKIGARRHVSHGAVDVVSRQTMNEFVTGTNPNAILAYTTPGANFTSSDALGLDAVADTLYVRGFNLTQLGVTMDGIPLGGQGFGNAYGLSIDQAEIQENVTSIAMSQGAGALDTPSTQTLGGAISYTTSDPLNKAGGQVSQMFGSYGAYRTFARADSGKLNDTGTKFYAAFSRTDQNLWKGAGGQDELLANFKGVQPIQGDRGKLTALFDYSRLDQDNYMPLTESMWKIMGRKTTYSMPNWSKAKGFACANAANLGLKAGGCAGVTLPDLPMGLDGQPIDPGNFQYAGNQYQQNYLSALNFDYKLFSNVTSRTVAYAQVSNGDYGNTQLGVSSPDGMPSAWMGQKSNTRRIGFTQNFDIHAGDRNLIKTGLWYENNRFQLPEYLWADQWDGPHDVHDYSKGSSTKWWQRNFNSNTFQFYVQDTFTITRGLKFTAGFKSLTETQNNNSRVNPGWKTVGNAYQLNGYNIPFYNHQASGSLNASNAFLPHFNLDYHFLQHHEAYIDIAENMRPYDTTAWSGLGSWHQSAQQAFNNAKYGLNGVAKLKPESTWNYLLGYRYSSPIFMLAADFYHTEYYNRLVSVTQTVGGYANGQYLNIGKERMFGADVLGTVRPFQNMTGSWLQGFALTNSFSWNNETYRNKAVPGLGANGGPLNLRGMHQVYYPKFMYKVDLAYHYQRFSFDFNANYNAKRYMTYTNDMKIPAYWTSSLTASYDFGKLGFAQNFKATFGVTNLFQQNYIGGVYGAASVKGDQNPNLFVAAPREFFGTIAAKF